MSKDNLHSFSFNLHSSIRSNTRIPILFLEDYEVWALHFKDYMLGIENHGSSIWHPMTMETYKYSRNKEEVKTQGQYYAIVDDNTKTTNDEKDKRMCNLKAMQIIKFALPPNTFVW